MKDKLDELYKLMHTNRKISPWIKQLSLKDALKELHSEIVEATEALEKSDDKNLKDSLR